VVEAEEDGAGEQEAEAGEEVGGPDGDDGSEDDVGAQEEGDVVEGEDEDDHGPEGKAEDE